MIPTSIHFDQSVMTALLDADPLVADYRAFFALFDWSVVDRWHLHSILPFFPVMLRNG